MFDRLSPGSETTDRVARGREIQRRTGSTFHVATRLLPERVRDPTYVLYGFFRVADEVVDGDGPDAPAAQRERLEEIRAAALGKRAATDPVVGAFAEVRETHGIDPADVHAFVDAMQVDTRRDRYETYEDLAAYMDGSAAAVGRMMTALMDPEDPEAALPHATALGEAFQLTNFLRDVREDAEGLGRVYLPLETLDAHDASAEDVLACRPTAGVRAAVADELARAEARYRTGVAGIRHLPEDCQFAVLLAAVLYAGYHRPIRDRNGDVFTDPPGLTRRRVVSLVARTRLRWAVSEDPAAVFAAVTGIDRSTDAPARPVAPFGDADAAGNPRFPDS
ncbi:MAG: phytoene/squalene synthase family protein [Haloferacaceae archaeon]